MVVLRLLVARGGGGATSTWSEKRSCQHPFSVERLTGAPFEAALEPVAFSLGGDAWPVDELRGKRVLAFSGLADNDQFFASLRNAGAELAGARSFPDHHRYASDEIAALRSEAATLHAAPVTTEKDWVKIGDESVGVVESAMRISGIEEIVARIEQLARTREGQRS